MDMPWPSGCTSRMAWSLSTVRCCVGLSMVLPQLKDPLEVFMKRIRFLAGYEFLSHRDMYGMPFAHLFYMCKGHTTY